MYDTNLVEFYGRVAKFEKASAKGYGHEAPGTLGRSATYGLFRKSRRRIGLMPLVFVVLAGFGLKATIYHTVGPVHYEARLTSLAAGEGFDRLGAWLMQVDPVTAYAAKQIGALAAALKP